MNESEGQMPSPQHNTIRAVLRIGGPIVAGLGLIFILVGFVSFFSSFGSFEPPRYFWCAFVGIPLFAVGSAMCKFGYLGAVIRYIADETAPVAKDAANYVGEGVQPGVKAVAKAITEGVLEAQSDRKGTGPNPK